MNKQKQVKRMMKSVFIALLTVCIMLPLFITSAIAKPYTYADDAAAAAEDMVCRIGAAGGQQYYKTLEEAFDDAETGATITMVADIVDITDTILRVCVDGTGKTLTLDGNGHKITGSLGSYLLRLEGTGAVLTIKNLTIFNDSTGNAFQTNSGATAFIYDSLFEVTGSSQYGALIAQAEAKISLCDGAVLKSTGKNTASGFSSGVRINGDNAVVNICRGAEVYADGCAVWNGVSKGTVNIFEGAKVVGSVNGVEPTAIYAQKTDSIINIYGGEIIGYGSSVLTSSGSIVSIYNGTFTLKCPDATATSEKVLAVIVSGRADGRLGRVTINGGKFVQEYADKPVIMRVAGAKEGTFMTINGGSFRGGYCAYYDEDKVSTAYEAGKTRYALSPDMRSEAYIRFVSGSEGLRFVSEINISAINAVNAIEDVTNISYGTIVCPADYLDYTENGELSFAALDDASIPGVTVKYGDIKANTGIIYNQDSSITIAASLVNISSANEGRDFAAASYIKYTVGVETKYLYSNAIIANAKEVAYEGLCDVSTESGTFGEYGYTNSVGSFYTPTENGYREVNMSVYSCYTAAQLEVLKSYIN